MRLSFLLLSLFISATSPAVTLERPLQPLQPLQLAGQWATAEGRTLELKQLEGKPTIVALFYTTCSTICPMVVGNLKELEKSLGARAKDAQFLLVSVDPRQDSPKELGKFAETHRLSGKPNWILLHGSLEQTRALAGRLNIGFDDKGAPDVHQMHSLELVALAPSGRLLGKTSSMKPEIKKLTELLFPTVDTFAKGVSK